MLYLDAKPSNATLAADCQTLSLNPWTEPLAELALQPRREQVNSLEVPWEKPRAIGCCSSRASSTAKPKCRRAPIACIP